MGASEGSQKHRDSQRLGGSGDDLARSFEVEMPTLAFESAPDPPTRSFVGPPVDAGIGQLWRRDGVANPK
jgi:hypothetical protein